MYRTRTGMADLHSLDLCTSISQRCTACVGDFVLAGLYNQLDNRACSSRPHEEKSWLQLYRGAGCLTHCYMYSGRLRRYDCCVLYLIRNTAVSTHFRSPGQGSQRFLRDLRGSGSRANPRTPRNGVQGRETRCFAAEHKRCCCR